ncbi:MAG: macro domain-containing protein, partial [Clostridiales bacterium]|nr:macro domain-containing protein [Clostridiales bacterium]
MPFRIIRDNIVNVAADAIVNTANPRPVVGAGTDTAVYEAAGRESLLAERRKIGRIKRGDAAATPAFALPAKYIIHTVSTGWKGGHFGERKILASCYRRSLEVAKELGCESIAIPLLAAGSYRVPKDIALTIALDEIRQFLMENDMDVTLVVFDREAYALSANLLFDVQSFIDDETAASLHEEEYRYDLRRRNLDETVKNIVSDTDYADYAYPRRLAEEEEERSFGAAPDMWNRPAKAAPPVPPAAAAPSIPCGAGAPAAGYGGKAAKRTAMPDFSDGAAESAAPEELADSAKVEVSEPADLLICAMAEPVEAVTDEMPDFTKVGMSFRDKLFELIDARGLTDPEV